MSRDRGAGQSAPPSVVKEGWLSLQGAQGQGRLVKGVLTTHSFDMYSVSAKRQAANMMMPKTKSASQTTLVVDSGLDKGSFADVQKAELSISHKSIHYPHPALADTLNSEVMAHSLLFSPDEPKHFASVVLTSSIKDVAHFMSLYLDLLVTKNLVGALEDIPESTKSSVETRIAKYCSAVVKFPSVVLNTSVIASLDQLISSLGHLNASLAEELKHNISKAQENSQKILQLSFTPETHVSALATPPVSPPVSKSKWAPHLLKLAEKGDYLPYSTMLAPGFVNELVDQVAAFHRRLWRYWSPTNDISLLFHIPKSNSNWKINPLVFDQDSPHFLGTLAATHILATDISDSTRALLLEKWIYAAAKLREQGDSVGWVAILLVIFDPAVLRLCSTWTKADRTVIARFAHGWGYEAFEIQKRVKIPFLQKKAFRTDTDDLGKKISKRDCVPYFGDAIIYDLNSGELELADKQLTRLEAIVAGWNAYCDSVQDEAEPIVTEEDPAYQCLFAVWSQQQPTTMPLDMNSLSFTIQPKLLGHYLPHFYHQILPLTSGAMIPVLFTTVMPSFRLFPRNTLVIASQPKMSNRPRNVVRRSSSFPPAGSPQTTGVSELDSGAREQLENTASAHVLGQVIRDLLNVGTDTIDTHSGIVFKAFARDDSDRRSSRTSSIIESLTRRSSYAGKHVVVKSASMVRLVDVLVLGAGIFGSDLILDSEAHIATLLATYRSFCSPAEMLDMLQVRVRCARGAARLLSEQQTLSSSVTWKQIWHLSEDDDRTDNVAIRIVSMVIEMLQHWVSNYFFDFLDDKLTLDAGGVLLNTLRQELSVGKYPEAVMSQCRRLTGAFSRHQFSIARQEQHAPSWLQYVFDEERQKVYKRNHHAPPELPVTNLDHDGGLGEINSMIDELDSLVLDAFKRITMIDWMKLFEVLEQQASDRLGLFNYAGSQYTSENDIVVQDVYSWLRTLRTPQTKARVLDSLPEPIVALVRLHCSLVSYFAAQVADPTLSSPHERRDRMCFILKMLGVLRSRMQFFNLSTDFDDQQGQHIPSLLENAISSSILLPESRAYASSWQAAGNEVSRMFAQSSAPIGIQHSNDSAPNSKNIYIPVIPTRHGRPVTVCIGWIVERLLEIVCCVPNTSVEHPDLINFDKRRYAYNLFKNMSSEFQGTESSETSPETIAKYFFLLGEPAKLAMVPSPLIDRKQHKESVSREGKGRIRVFTDIISQELDKLKAESRMHDKIERSAVPMNNSSGSQSFYGLPMSQSTTSLYSKRLSRLIPSTSTVDVSSILDLASNQTSAPPSVSSGGSALNSNESIASSPTKRMPSQSKRSRFGGFLKAVRPLSVLGSSGNSSNHSSPNTASGSHISSPSLAQSPTARSMYMHPMGSSSSIQSNLEDVQPQESLWSMDETIDLLASPPLEDYAIDEWQPVQSVELDVFTNVDLRSNYLSMTHRSGPKLESIVVRASPGDAQEWADAVLATMRKKLLNSTRVFGVPLDIVCERENRNIPAFLETLLQLIESRGLDEVGIYRISGSLASVNSIKQWFDQGNITAKPNDSRWSDINAIAGCVKLYLRELPKPLMTEDLLPDFMQAITPAGVDIGLLRAAIEKLPTPNYDVLARISKHLKLIVDHSSQNKMNVQNIAIVFSVNFLPHVAMSQMGGMQQLVSTLVLQRDEVFT